MQKESTVLKTWATLSVALHSINTRYIRPTRSRFSIEPYYWMRKRVKPRTSTKNPVIWYLYAIISYLLKNVWDRSALDAFLADEVGAENHRYARVRI